MSIQSPNIVEATPHALGLIPLLICPRIKDVFPSDVASVRTRVTTMPATKINSARTTTEENAPMIPDLAMEPTPCGIKNGDLTQASHANHRPRYVSRINSSRPLHSLYLSLIHI